MKYSQKFIHFVFIVFAGLLSACLPDFADRFDKTFIPLTIGKHSFEVPRNYLNDKKSLSMRLHLPDLMPREIENDKQINDPNFHVIIDVYDYAPPNSVSSSQISENNKEDQKERLARYIKESEGHVVVKNEPSKKVTIFSKLEAKKNSVGVNYDLYVFGDRNNPNFLLRCTSSISKAKRPYCRYDGIIFGNLTLNYRFPITDLEKAIEIHTSILDLLTKFHKEASDHISYN